jgi:hypothetical protein
LGFYGKKNENFSTPNGFPFTASAIAFHSFTSNLPISTLPGLKLFLISKYPRKGQAVVYVAINQKHRAEARLVFIFIDLPTTQLDCHSLKAIILNPF